MTKGLPGQRRCYATLVVGVALAGTAAGCGSAAKAAAPIRFGVTAGDSTCVLSTDKLLTGNQAINVTNTGSVVTEVYVLAPDGLSLGEIENVNPGQTKTFSVTLKTPGGHYVQCRPNMKGAGIVAPVTVALRPGSPKVLDNPMDDAAVAGYRAFVQQNADDLQAKAAAFAATVDSGNLAAATAAYPAARIPYERIEAVAETFSDLDARIDSRENDQPADQWTGFHRLEKAIYTTQDLTGAGTYADELAADTATLDSKIKTLQFTVTDLGNGAKALLDEVATTKINGEEERYSHIDLLDFRANIDGSEQAFTELKPLLASTNAPLAATITTGFGDVDTALAAYADPTQASGYVPFATLGDTQRRQLAALIDALLNPVGHLTAAVTPAGS